jgi:trimeric autotransporter adhesin
MYCFGGNQVYYAAISPSGIRDWSSTTSYPVGTQTSVAPVCAASAGYIYCVGGDDGSPTTLRYSVYYASLSASGVGTWVQTTNTTGASNSQSCFISGSYLYCVGGNYGISTMTTRNVVYAPISSAGVGNWTNTTLYPVPVDYENCVTSGSYVYCIGGTQYVGGYSWTSAAYYTSISPSGGLGVWTSTTVYPNGISPSPCVSSGGYVYCMNGFNYPEGVNNGSVFYAPLSSAGIGPWSNTVSYPGGSGYPNRSSCVALSGHIYCLGGNTVTDTPAYYANVVTSSTSQMAIIARDTSGSSITEQAVLNQSGSIVVIGATPYTFTLNDGQSYTVQVDNGDSCNFSHWADTGSTSPSRTVSISNNNKYTAIMNCGTETSGPGTVTVKALDQSNVSISVPVLLCSSGTSGQANGGNDCEDHGAGYLSSGYTPVTFSGLPSGGIDALDNQTCSFSHWGNFTSQTDQLALFNAANGPVELTAVYYCAPTSHLMVVTQDTDGNPLPGYSATLDQNGSTISTAYTPATLTLADGQKYTVSVGVGLDGYGTCQFDYWLGTDNTTAVRSISITNGTQITAVMSCPAATGTSTSSTTASSTSSSQTSTAESSSTSQTTQSSVSGVPPTSVATSSSSTIESSSLANATSSTSSTTSTTSASSNVSSLHLAIVAFEAIVIAGAFGITRRLRKR